MDRGTFIKSLGIFSIGMTGLKTLLKGLDDAPETDHMQPALFIGHGNPMNVLEKNAFTEALSKLGKTLERPKAILVVSAHWLTRGTMVAVTEKPKTIYDFGGFPEEMYKIKYECPGAPEYAKLAKEAISSTEVKLDHDWGLDHGSWTILKHIYPDADIPVFQMSIDFRKETQYHYEIASYLKSLRKKGVLIIGSGNITHNLGKFEWDVNAKPYDWALEFDEKIKKNLVDQNHQEIINYMNWGQISKMAHPTNDHFLPLLYTIALQDKKEESKFIFEGILHGGLSMRCVQFG
jgi:4,5-DOPA dioxygenase extradiol